MRRRRALGLALALVALGACRDQAEEDAAAPTVPLVPVVPAPAPVTPDAKTDDGDAVPPGSFAELADLPHATPIRTVTLPTRPDVPRFTVGGPALLGDVAIVGSSQLGFAAVDWRRGQIAWTKPTGSRIAPPLARPDPGDAVLIGECVQPPAIPANRMLLGCARIVTPTGSDLAYFAIHGSQSGVAPFANSAGDQELWPDGDDAVRWRRGDQAVRVDLLTGIATAASAAPPPVVVSHQGRTWEIEQIDGKMVAHSGGKKAWATRGVYGELLGSVQLPDSVPMIRMANIREFAGQPELRLLDMDATGSMNGTATWTPIPGFMIVGRAITSIGDTALAMRLDRNIKRDYIAGFAANGLLMWVFPLPEVLRPDRIGVAIALDADGAPEAVIAFYDGDQVVVLPNLLAPPTAPGATHGASQNSTP